MKLTLCSLLFVGIGWLVGLSIQGQVLPVVALDAVLPPRILAATTSEERIQIVVRLRQMIAPGITSWLGAGTVLVLSGSALILLRSNQRK